MLARLVAAILIASFALVGVEGGLSPANAEPRGRYRRGRGRGRPQIHQHFDNPLGSILGGIFGGWLAEQMRPAPPPPPPPAPYYDDEEEDDLERDRR